MRPKAELSLLNGLAGEIAEIDYFDDAALTGLLVNADCVFHVAARVSDVGPDNEFLRTNVGLTKSIAQAALAARVPRLVYVSSATVYGSTSRRNLCETDTCEELKLPYSRTSASPSNSCSD